MYPSGFHQPRAKIDAIIRRQDGIPDEDAPSDPASLRFWCTTGSTYTDKEKMEISMVSQAAVRTTGDSLAGLLEGQCAAPSGPLALTDGSASAPGPSLETLLNVARAPVADCKAKAKAKPKAKAKGAPGPQTEKTPAEKRELARTLYQIRISIHNRTDRNSTAHIYIYIYIMYNNI